MSERSRRLARKQRTKRGVLQIDDLEHVAIGVVEIGRPTDEDAVIAHLAIEHAHAILLELRDRGLELIGFNREGGMEERVARKIAAIRVRRWPVSVRMT